MLIFLLIEIRIKTVLFMHLKDIFNNDVTEQSSFVKGLNALEKSRAIWIFYLFELLLKNTCKHSCLFPGHLLALNSDFRIMIIPWAVHILCSACGANSPQILMCSFFFKHQRKTTLLLGGLVQSSKVKEHKSKRTWNCNMEDVTFHPSDANKVLETVGNSSPLRLKGLE